MNKTLLLTAAGIGTLVIAGCGSSSNSPSAGTPAAQQAAGGSAMTVSVGSVSGLGSVLVNSQGHTLYTDDQEKNGKILCAKADCTAIWSPLTVAAGQMPTSPSSITGKLSTVTRPDGTHQVTINGAPLYTFTYDHAAGDGQGNGQKDSFDGTSFTWHAVTPAGAAVGQSGGNGGGNGGGYGGNGGGYGGSGGGYGGSGGNGGGYGGGYGGYGG